MPNCGVYEIVNLMNNKRYIGSSKDLAARKKQHFRGSQSNPHMQCAMRKYGKENFVFNVLEYVCESDLLSVEQFYIDTLNPEYNICRVAGNRLGVPVSDQTKGKISEKLRGRVVSEATREKLRTAHTGKKASPETIEKLVTSHTGKTLTKEQKQKIGDAHRGRKHSDDSKAKMSKNRSKGQVRCVSNGVIYDSVKDAANKLNLNLMSIYYALSKDDKSVHGFVFEQVEKIKGDTL